MRSTFLKPFNIFNILSEVTVKDEADEFDVREDCDDKKSSNGSVESWLLSIVLSMVDSLLAENKVQYRINSTTLLNK